MDQRRWSDLVPDVLREISSRVCAATDFAHFHAVCKRWRNSHDPLSRKTMTTRFLPWLLEAADKESTHLRFRRIFSKSSSRVMFQTLTVAGAARNWVSTADGTQVRYLTVEHLRPTLHDPFTGGFTHLPLFPDNVGRWEEENLGGVIYSDTTTFLYSLWYAGDFTARFTAALLGPGDSQWTVIERILMAPRSRCHEFCAAYHGGKIMVTEGDTLCWHVVTPDGGTPDTDVLLSMPSHLRFRRIFSKSSSRVMFQTPAVAGTARNWVSTADGTQVRYLTVEHLRPTLHDPFTGGFTHLPLFPDNVGRWEEENLGGVIYSDTTTFLYSLWYAGDFTARFTAALLGPGDSQWTVVERILMAPRSRCHEFCAAYHGGKIMVTEGDTLCWHVVTPDGGTPDTDVLLSMPSSTWREREYYSSHYNFVLKSRGELLWALVKVSAWTAQICVDMDGMIGLASAHGLTEGSLVHGEKI